MTDISARSTFDALCTALGLPLVECAPRDRLAALPEWVRSLADGGKFPAWFRPSLISTPAARNRLRTWAETTPRPWPNPTPSEILAALCVIGDEYCAARIAGVCHQRLPLPVIYYVIQHVVIVATGIRALGFCSPPRLTSDLRHWLVVVASRGPDDPHFGDLIGHEVAHVWTLPAPRADQCCAGCVFASAVTDLELRHVPAAYRPTVIAAREVYDRGENVARRLAASWGFASDVDSVD
jgi:hypothetical protein